jgi:hypothetical protein
LNVLDPDDYTGEPAMKERPARRSRLTPRKRPAEGSTLAAPASRTWDIIGFVCAAIFIGIVVFSLKPLHNQTAGNSPHSVASASVAPAKIQ